MTTQEIPREEWNGFFNDFSARHRGWIVSLEEIGAGSGDQQSEQLPLVGIASDTKDGENRISIMLGGVPAADVNRIINQPERVWFKHSDDERFDALDVEYGSGAKTLLKFQSQPAGDAGHQLMDNT